MTLTATDFVNCRVTNAHGQVRTYKRLDEALDAIARAKARGGYHLLGVVGSRRRDTPTDYDLVLAAILAIAQAGPLCLVSGACPQGADRLARLVAERHNLPIVEFVAEWVRLGQRAGFVRNEWIAQCSDELLALPASDRTGGTENTIAHAVRLGVPVTLL